VPKFGWVYTTVAANNLRRLSSRECRANSVLPKAIPEIR
jgi:hypothetical protein